MMSPATTEREFDRSIPAGTEDAADILIAIMNERHRQIGKWGSQSTVSHHKWFTIMVEELGEAARASLHENDEKEDAPKLDMSSRQELVQLAAIIFRALEVWSCTTIHGGPVHP